jgi:hypothetical protein
MLTVSSCRRAGFPEWVRDVLAGEALGTLPSATTAAIKKLTPTMTFWQPLPTQNFLRFLTLNLIFLARVRQTGSQWRDEVHGAIE